MLVLRVTVVLALACVSAAQSRSNFTNSTTAGSASTTPSPSRDMTLMASSSSVALNASISATRNNTGALCNSRSLAWTKASSSFSSANPMIVTDVVTSNYTRTLWQSLRYNCTHMCGTICYAGPSTLLSSTEAVYSVSTRTWKSWANYPVPKPNCTIGFNDCLALTTSFSSDWNSYWDLPSSSRELTTMPERPQCSACVSTACTFGYIGMSLYYWPPTTTASRDLCAWDPIGGVATTNLPNPNSSYTEVRTGAYAVVDGFTMYEGNVYLSLDEPQVYDNCRTSVTRAKPGNNIITLASTDLYSVRKYPHNLLPWSVNYDDFNYPVPWSAYLGGRYCANNRPICSVVFNDDYHPVMVMPHEMRFLDKNWETCLYDQYGIFDPPIALKSVGNPFSSSTTSAPPATTTVADPKPVVTPPTPGQPPSNGNPGPTRSPDPPNNPPSNDDPSDSPGNNTPNPNPSPNDPQNPPNTNPNNPQNPPANNPNPSNPQNPPSNNNPSPNNPQNLPAPGSNPTNESPRPTGPSNNAPENPSPPRVTLGPSVVPVNPGGGVVLDPGTTLSQGAPPAVISGTTFSMGNGGLTIISPTTSTQVPLGNGPVTVSLGPGNAPITLDPAGTVVLGGKTLRPDGPAVTVDGSTLSIGPSGIVVIDPSGSTSTIPMPAGSPQVLTIGPSTFTAVGGDLTIAPGTTLRFGDDPMTVSGTTYSIGPSGLVVISPEGTSTVPISIATQVLTIGSNTYTLYDGDLVLGPGTTIGVGDPAVTIDGTTYSVGPSGVVVLSDGGGTTVPVTGTGTGAASGPTQPAEGAAAAASREWTWAVGLVGALAGWNLV